MNIFSQTGISLDIRTVSSKDYFLRTSFCIRKIVKKTLMCREYCVGTPLVLFIHVADGGTIGLQWRTKYWKHLIKINTSKLA